MSRHLGEPGSRVKEALLFGDPAADDARLGADERIRMRAGLSRGATGQPSGHGRRWQQVFAFGATVLLAGVLWYWPAWAPAPSVSSPVASVAKPAAQPGSERGQPAVAASMNGDVRQIRFVTKGGTRVIWLLNPRFNY